MTQASVLEWLVRRQPKRPTALAARMDRFVCENDAAKLAAEAGMSGALALLGMAMLRLVTARSTEDPLPEAAQRDALALDLLAADAFVTYAFEAAAEESADVPKLVARLLEQAA